MPFLLALTKVLWQVIKISATKTNLYEFPCTGIRSITLYQIMLFLLLAFLGSLELNTMNFEYFITGKMTENLLIRLGNIAHTLIYVLWSL